MTFVTCNRDHHVLNVIQAPFATMHHLAFQLDGRDHQFRAADLLTRHAVPTLLGGRRGTPRGTTSPRITTVPTAR